MRPVARGLLDEGVDRCVRDRVSRADVEPRLMVAAACCHGGRHRDGDGGRSIRPEASSRVKPAQRSTGRAGYLEKRESTSERRQRQYTFPRAVSTRWPCRHVSQSPGQTHWPAGGGESFMFRLPNLPLRTGRPSVRCRLQPSSRPSFEATGSSHGGPCSCRLPFRCRCSADSCC